MVVELYDEKKITNNKLDHALITMKNIVARKQTQWSSRETKLFLAALSQIRDRDSENWVTMSKADIIEILNMDPSDTTRLRTLFKDVANKSWVQFNGKDEHEWVDGFLISSAKATRNSVSVQFNQTYLPLLVELENHFTFFYLDNIAHFKSKFAIILFQNLKSWYNPEGMINHKKYSLADLKNMFELGPKDYVRRSGPNKGTFDVYNFKKNTLDKAIAEINANPSKSGMYIQEIKPLKHQGMIAGYDIAYCLVNKDGTPYVKGEKNNHEEVEQEKGNKEELIYENKTKSPKVKSKNKKKDMASMYLEKQKEREEISKSLDISKEEILEELDDLLSDIDSI